VERQCPATKTCPGGETVLQTEQCRSISCAGGAVVRVGQECPPTKVCPGGETILQTQECRTIDCGNGVVVNEGQKCPDRTICPGGETVVAPQQCPTNTPTAIVCPSGETVYAPQVCRTKLCPGGVIVHVEQQCPATKPCPNGTVVLAGQQCQQPACWTCKFYPMTSDSIPYWAALVAAIAMITGAAVGGTKLYRSRLIKRTQKLLAVNGSLDTSQSKASDDELALDGPPIRLRGYLGPEET
jgi:hypothetical protein